ncbi:efflux RND transporter permease subunit [Thalassomonas actiniarum]|uniref:Efflux RND transporter permease subunit n=1 Tax=Thalassomonas actiniarum TaxID=485447 RepID=A0AAE9YSR3_9GAMM|nr:efflux RND transporter permease subunit [Thalassomonas actiniarum]WDD99599.1 efflux RND transporter permease subunit [Thalassomonas actiniarum]
MNITKISFEYRKSIFMLLALMLVNGVFAYFTLPAQEDPTTVVREAIVSTAYPGMSPERVEQLITKTLEKEIRKVPEVKKITSTSETGTSIIHVQIYDRYFNLEDIWQDVRNRVSEAAANLPEGTMTSRVNDSFGDVSVITLALTADGFNLGEMRDMAKHIRDLLYTVPGTKKVEVLGVQDERIFLESSSAKLAQLGISPQSIVNALQNQNIISSGGQVDTGDTSFIVEPSGNFNSLEEIAETRISIPGSQDSIALKDIVTVRRGYIDPPDEPAYFNGQPAIMFGVAMLENYNVPDFNTLVKQQVADIQATLPVGYQIGLATDQSVQVKEKIDGVSGNVLQTLIIVLLVVILFLGMRTGLIVGSIVPFVMLGTLAIMKVSGIKLEQLSLSTLIIALGLLVDNGIVIAEDFKRRLEQGTDRYQAMCRGGKELAMPLLSSSVTTILFFLPLMLAEHVAGEFTRSVSLVILITLLTSWVLAICVTPILCYLFIRVKPKERGKVTEPEQAGSAAKYYGYYENFLHWILSHKALFIGIVIAIFVLAMGGFKFVAQQFFPNSDRSQVLMYVDLPNGTSARQTNRQMKEIFAWLDDKQRFPEIQSYAGYSGFDGPRFVASLSPEDPADNKGFVVLNMAEAVTLEQLDPFVDKLHREMVETFPNVSARVKRMFVGPSDSSVIKIQVKGPDKDVLYAKAEEIMAVLHQLPNTKNVRTDWQNRIVKVKVQIDQQRARRAGVTSDDIASALQGYFDGVTVTEYREQDNIIPVVLQGKDEERFNLDRLRTVTVFSSSLGQGVPLFQVADFVPENQYSRIKRENMFRTISVLATNTAISAQDMQLAIDDKIQLLKADLPLNHSIEYDGVIVESAEAQQAMGTSVPMVVGLVIILLVMQFNSYRRAAIIVLTIPLSMIGTVGGLIIMDAPFGFMVTLGIYSLAGIIINNAIVLIDRIDIERRSGISDYQAIINACKTRLRPIAMTTITTIMGLLPLIMDPASVFYGMASVLAFGLGIGTVLTLGVVPVLYAMFFKVTIKVEPDTRKFEVENYKEQQVA